MNRSEYLSRAGDADAHREYYGQYVTGIVKRDVLWTISKDRILSSQDPHFNDIPLRHWDALPAWGSVAQEMKERGDYLTLAGKVSVAKEAAQQIKEAGGKL